MFEIRIADCQIKLFEAFITLPSISIISSHHVDKVTCPSIQIVTEKLYPTGLYIYCIKWLIIMMFNLTLLQLRKYTNKHKKFFSCRHVQLIEKIKLACLMHTIIIISPVAVELSTCGVAGAVGAT